jgi:hypothetical protein
MEADPSTAIPFREGHRFVPVNIRLESDAALGTVLAWDDVEPETLDQSVTVEGDGGVLREFVALADGTDARILRFAKKHGVLEICGHWEPSHLDRRLPEPYRCEPLRREPLHVWRAYAGWASALLAVSADIHQGRPGSAEDWGAIENWVGLQRETYGGGRRAPTPQLNRSFVSQAVGKWIYMGDLRVMFDWRDRSDPHPGGPDRSWPHGPHVVLVGEGLFAALARQIVFSVSRSGGIAMCAECGKRIKPGERRPGNQRTFCQKCRKAGAAVKHAKRDYRARRRSAALASKEPAQQA